jgi:GGDEF domain-containing protein
LSIDPRRLLGLAFASADLLLEIENGQVVLALGAAQRIMGRDERTLVGRAWRDLFTAADRPLMDSVMSALTDGFRRGPITVRLAGEPPRHVSLTLRALPENGGRVSVSATSALVPAAGLDATGLRPRDNFEDIARGLFEAARVTGLELELAMVDFAGLDSLREQLSPREVHALDVKLAGAVRAESHAGGMATRLSPDRFALVRAKADHPDDMAERLTRATTIEASAHVVPLDGGVAPARGLKALRYALDDFLREGLKDTAADQPVGGHEPFGAAHPGPRRRPGRGGQPAAVHPGLPARRRPGHRRRPPPRGPGALRGRRQSVRPDPHGRGIRPDRGTRPRHRRVGGQAHRPRPLGRAEAGRQRLGPHDRQRGLRRPRHPHLLKDQPSAKNRLIFEITETAAIDDLPRANRHIQALREMGSLVCLDDFGAGSSSFAYLQELTLDIVKIDGRYVRELAGNGRDGAMVRRLVELCRDLKIRTVAEMVETLEVEEVVRKAGVDFAQGWLFGKPTDTPQPALKPCTSVKPAARRAGASESWG